MTGNLSSNDQADQVLHWRRELRPAVMDAECVLLFNERERFRLTGRAHVILARWIDGRRTLDAIAAEAGIVPASEIHQAAERLCERGYLAPVPRPGRDSDAREWLEQIGVSITPSRDEPRRSVRLHDFGARESTLLADSLCELNPRLSLAQSGSTDQAALDVVQVDDYLDPRLSAFNRRAREADQPWVLVKAYGSMPLVGPIFRGRSGACWECLASRIRCNRPVERYISRQKSERFPLPRLPRAGFGAEITVRLFSLWLVEWLNTQDTELTDHVLAFDFRDGKRTRHQVVRRPQCDECGDPKLMARHMTSPIALQSRPYTRGSCRRIDETEQTLERLRIHVSPIAGVLASLGPLRGVSGRNTAVHAASWFRCPAHANPSQDDFHRTSLGRGLTQLDAEVSALCEALERQSAAFQGDESTVRARAEELGALAIAPDKLLNFSDRQYLQRELFNTKYAGVAQPIPPAYDGREIRWSPVWSLSAQQQRFVPTSLCFYDSVPSDEQDFCPYDSNGDAAGNCLEEAILQGFLELVERDGVSLWWYNRARRPAVDVSSFGTPHLNRLLAQYARAGWELWVLDVTTDLAIPTFVAFGVDAVREQFSIGFGADLDPRRALERALTEFNQLCELDNHRSLPMDLLPLQGKDYLCPTPALGVRTFSDYECFERLDLRKDIDDCVARAGRLGLEVLVANRTRPDVELCVAKVIVPGLRHFWPRFGAGRLFETPVRLGWVSAAIAEEQLNPIPLLL